MGMIKTGVNKTTKLTVKAYPSDKKTLLAFNLPEAKAKQLAGFTIQAQPKGQPPYFIFNKLRFEHPERHAQDAKEPAESSINSPIHKFRWVHVPGSIHQGVKPFFGPYKYVVTPRYFDPAGRMLPLDPENSTAVTINVRAFQTKKLELGFTRGFIQSQAFVNHFGIDAKIRPDGHDLLFDLKQVAGRNALGEEFTYEDEYAWLGFTAREKVLALLDEVSTNSKLRVDVFAYDLNAPDVVERMLKIAKTGRIRIILDNSSLHHNAENTKPEDQFEILFTKAKKAGAEILRGQFKRYSHDKIFIVYDARGPRTVLTGSTNFSVTGLYVNSNHVIVFHDRIVAKKYAEVFEYAWTTKTDQTKFQQSALANGAFEHESSATPKISVTFSPHTEPVANGILKDIVGRIEQEKTGGSVFFAVMQLSGGGDLIPTLQNIHADPGVFSFGISDQPDGIYLYKPQQPTGILVTGKPEKARLPLPFSQVPSIGLRHQIHHKFVVCGINGKNPVVYCGSSNLALGGEQENGDNLIAIHDHDAAMAFTIEAVLLVDHFQFLDGVGRAQGPKLGDSTTPDPRGAASAHWFLSTDDGWTRPYFDAGDLRARDRALFG